MSLVGALEAASSGTPNILLLDIETAPTLAYVWEKWKANALSTEQHWFVLCVAWKWLDSDTEFLSVADDPNWEPHSDNDLLVVTKVWELMNQADVIVAQNGDRFDIRKIQARFFHHRLPPTERFQTVDTLKVMRKHFNMFSNSLNDVAEYLGIEGKVSTGGFGLWKACMAGDSEAWDRMRAYNMRDVEVLEAVYRELVPWTTRPRPNGQINLAHWAPEGENACPACGARGTLRLAGTPHRTAVSEFQSWRCDSCGAVSRSRWRKPQWRKGVRTR